MNLHIPTWRSWDGTHWRCDCGRWGRWESAGAGVRAYAAGGKMEAKLERSLRQYQARKARQPALGVVPRSP